VVVGEIAPHVRPSCFRQVRVLNVGGNTESGNGFVFSSIFIMWTTKQVFVFVVFCESELRVFFCYLA
jgi:hypothetical protein